MDLEGMDRRYVLYGTLSALDNRLQACEQGAFPDMTMKQHFLLIVVDLFGDEHPTLKQVADVAGCSYQNVKRLASQLEKKGYLRICGDPGDRRKLRLVPTPRYRELDAAARRATACFMDRLYQGISDEELAVTLRTVQRMERNARNGDGQATG